MTKDEIKNKYSAFIAEISEIMGLGKPIDILKLCKTTYLFFRPLEKRIADLEKENAELKSEKGCETCTKFDEMNLTKAKELLAKWVELYKPKSNIALPTPIQVDTEQFLSEVEK